MVDNESSNINPGTGQVNRKGYTGLIKGTDFILRQFKYIALGTLADIDIFYKKEPYPRDAIVRFNSSTMPITAPLVFNRFSYDSSMYVEFQIDRSGVAATTQTIYLACVEYEMEPVDLVQGEIYREVYVDGFLSEPKKVE